MAGYYVGLDYTYNLVDPQHHGRNVGANYLFLDFHTESLRQLPRYPSSANAWDPGSSGS